MPRACNLSDCFSIYMNESNNKMSDQELVKRCLENDSIAQKKLFDTYAGRMMGVCLRYANDRDEAQDVLQMGFIKVFEKLSQFSGKGSLEGWIRRIVVNAALDNIRRNKHTQDDVSMDKVDFMVYDNVNAIDGLAAKDLLKLINNMPDGFKAVFNMYAIEGYTHKEIAEELGISVNTSKSQYSRARTYLQNVLKDLEVKQ